ncbi:MAG TPA: homoserine dehydrogenase [Rhizomicrobium sp.]|jgi:homoserine dehydrogenase|nr:homoserine dehydrogenase [Rhizomicrobium sp.]
MTTPLRIAVAGLGTVGGGVVRVLAERSEDLGHRAGRAILLSQVCALDRAKRRTHDLAALKWAHSALDLAQSDADVVVELIGGDNGIALDLIFAALSNGKHVVTANKSLLARHGADLAELAERKGVALKFEAAVAGGIPIVKALRESLVAHGIGAVRGILNGTCNFILTQMEATGRSFEDVLVEAQRMGFAEADPSLDVGGHDTAHKLALLASLAFGIRPSLEQMTVEGIANITPEDIAFAREFGYRIKLLGVARQGPDGIDQRVHPAMVKSGTPLADVEGAFNAVVADAGEAGPFFFAGRGAGQAPTASAVVADILDIARGAIGPAFGRPARELETAKPAQESARASAFYLRFQALDQPGVLAEIAARLARAQVSIESMIQRGRALGETVAIVMITHPCTPFAVESALKDIAASAKILVAPTLIHMEPA